MLIGQCESYFEMLPRAPPAPLNLIVHHGLTTPVRPAHGAEEHHLPSGDNLTSSAPQVRLTNYRLHTSPPSLTRPAEMHAAQRFLIPCSPRKTKIWPMSKISMRVRKREEVNSDRLPLSWKEYFWLYLMTMLAAEASSQIRGASQSATALLPWAHAGRSSSSPRAPPAWSSAPPARLLSTGRPARSLLLASFCSTPSMLQSNDRPSQSLHRA